MLQNLSNALASINNTINFTVSSQCLSSNVAVLIAGPFSLQLDCIHLPPLMCDEESEFCSIIACISLG